MRTSRNYTVNFRDYGPITVPAGTRVSYQTAYGIDPNYHFVDEFGWIFKDYPSIAYMLKHDVVHYGINVPKECVTND